MFKKKQNAKPNKKQVKKITIELKYDKGSFTPDEINVKKDCSLVDMITAMIRLMEIICAEAQEGGADLTSFFVTCAYSYIKQHAED